MPNPIPNLAELMAALEGQPDSLELVACFSADQIEVARVALRSKLAEWDDEATR
ncbi:MAG TPA: hypothetical protein VL068_05465 [Microthrixaceae bacterium]|nr:hypothetical protein [Microthrixaceae bacterium]